MWTGVWTGTSYGVQTDVDDEDETSHGAGRERMSGKWTVKFTREETFGRGRKRGTYL